MTLLTVLIAIVVCALIITIMWWTIRRRKKDKLSLHTNSDMTFNSQFQDTDEHHDEVSDVVVKQAAHSDSNARSNATLSSLGFGSVDDVLTPVLAKPVNDTNPKRSEMYLPQNEDLVVIHLKAATGKMFGGYGLQQALIAAGLQYGEMSIFHYYEERAGKRTILFSVASAIEPGIFDLQRIGAFNTPGLSLFMTVANCVEPLKTLNLLLDISQQLTDDLGGQLFDQQHKPFTKNTINDYRSRVNEMALM